jgi:signal transduction histidine kinase
MELTRSISAFFPRILKTRLTPPTSALVMKNISRYTRLVTLCGGLVILNSIFNPLHTVNWLDSRLIFIASVAVLIGSRIVVRIPGMPSYFSMSETLVFLVMFMFGGDAAIVLAAAAESSASLNFSKKPSTILFNGAASSIATAITVWGLRLSFGPVTELLNNDFTGKLVIAVCLMGMLQYAGNSAIVSVLAAMKVGRPIWQTWKEKYLWSSITYLAGASAATVSARLISSVGLYALLVTTPLVIIIYLTYKTYIESIDRANDEAETARVHAEELAALATQRNNALQIAEQSSRVKDEFLAILSHELRTPLTSILLWADLMESTQDNAASFRQGVEVIRRNGGALRQMIDDVLDVSRIVNGKMSINLQSVDLINSINTLCESVKQTARAKDISLRMVTDYPGLPVSADPQRLEQVLWNLLANALKFTPNGGTIEVQVRNDGDLAQVSVKDSGPGIDPDFLPHVFDRFTQADSSTTRRYGGLGLGLSIVRYIVEMHGGFVQAESPGVGKGSIFSFHIPIVRELLPAVSVEQKTKPPSLAGYRIVLVEDEPDTNELIRSVLTAAGAVTHSFLQASLALPYIQSCHPHAVISDIMMPGMDGYTFVKKVNEISNAQGVSIPTIAVSASVGDSKRQQALNAGFQDFVEKPIDMSVLLTTIRKAAVAEH